MRRRVDLVDEFADIVVGADDPRRLAERTLDVMIALGNGRAGAVFAREGTGFSLFASRGIDQHVLDTVPRIWEERRDLLLRGEAFYASDRATDRRLPRSERAGPPSFVVVPVQSGGLLSALVYLDSAEPRFCTPHDLERLGKFARIIAKAVSDSRRPDRDRGAPETWQAYLERTPIRDMERDKLLLLLNRNEWNIARVARLMGVTRRTVYLRLQRHGIPRERVRRSASRTKRPA